MIGIGDTEMVQAVEKNEDGNWIADRAYGALVSQVLPKWLLGFFAAVVVGSILSTGVVTRVTKAKGAQEAHMDYIYKELTRGERMHHMVRASAAI